MRNGRRTRPGRPEPARRSPKPRPKPLRLLIGIDDTDSRTSRGTGYRAREVGRRLAAAGLAQVQGITRHQLLVDPRIRYTSHNSAACLLLRVDPRSLDALTDNCRRYLRRSSAVGADPGLCVAVFRAVRPPVKRFGRLAKLKVLPAAQARAVAERNGISLEGLAGTEDGVIGALAAVGLRAGENDGRFVWLPGLRELRGRHSAAALCRTASIDEIRDVKGRRVPGGAVIDVRPGFWPRPILRAGRAVLLVQELQNGRDEWRVADREIVRRHSD